MKHLTKRARRERGVAILITIFALVLLTAVAAAMIFLSSTDTDINRNYRSGQKTYFGAKAGLERVRARMVPALNDLTGANIPQLLPGTANANSVLYIKNPASGETVDPTSTSNEYYDSELCHEFPGLFGTSLAPGVPCSTAFPTTGAITTQTDTLNNPGTTYDMQYLPWKWVRITMKTNISASNTSSSTASTGWVNGTYSNTDTTSQGNQVCYDGVHEFVAANAGLVDCVTQIGPNPNFWTPVYVLTSLAMDNSLSAVGAAPTKRWSQMEVAILPPVNPSGAITAQDVVKLNGQLNVNGYDYCSCQCTTTKVGGTDVVSCTDRTGKTCDRTKWGIYSAQNVDSPNSSETIVGGQMNNSYSPPASIATNQPWPYDIPNMINSLKGTGTNLSTSAPYNYNCTAPNYSVSPPTNGNCGTQSGQTYGTLPAGMTSSSGPTDPNAAPSNNVYYAPGNLKLTANSSGNGILIVDGDLEINGGLLFYGLILVRGTISFTGGGSQTTNIYGAVLAGQESYTNIVVGGSASINFDYCALPQGGKNRSPVIISYRELEY
jgi:hypothetical protein